MANRIINLEPSTGLVLNDFTVALYDERKLEISLAWLKKAGFQGKVVVTKGIFGGEPVSEWEIPEPTATAELKEIRLTEAQAIDISIALWKWIVNTHATHPACKTDWPGWASNGGTIPPMKDDCPLCERTQPDHKLKEPCFHCPYYQTFGYQCTDEQSPYRKWCSSFKEHKCARDFLFQLHELRCAIVGTVETTHIMDSCISGYTECEEDTLAQEALDKIADVMCFEEGCVPDLDADASLQNLIDAFVAAKAALIDTVHQGG